MKKFGVTIGLLVVLVSITHADVVDLQEGATLPANLGGNTYNGTMDTYLIDQYPDSANGSSSELRIGRNSSVRLCRTLVKWDMSTLTPPVGQKIVVNNAWLALYYYGTSSLDHDFDIDIHRVLTTWDEVTATWNNFGGSGGGQPGTGYDQNAVAAVTCAAGKGTHGYDRMETSNNVNVTNLVQGWIDGDIDNNGAIYISQTEGSSGDFRAFKSSEHTDGVNVRPRLKIDYDLVPVPEPATIGLMLMGIVGLMRRR